MPAVPKKARIWVVEVPNEKVSSQSFRQEERDIEYGDHDLLVEVKAVSINPVDTKVRKGYGGAKDTKQLGYDASGLVAAAGKSVTAYKVGDEVYYAGSIARHGTNCDYHAVDERLVGPKPKTLSHAEAAALPLCTLTAWETLFVLMRIPKAASSKGTLLVLGGAGGVGSILIQLARHYTSLTVIATATRPESVDFCKRMGAHHVVSHHDLPKHVKPLAPKGVDYIFCSKTTQRTIDEYVDVAAHRAHIVQIDEPRGMEYSSFQGKALTLSYEMMMSTAIFEPESTAQRDILTEVSKLVDDGKLQTTLTQTLRGLNAQKLCEGHQQLESGSTVGKLVITRD